MDDIQVVQLGDGTGASPQLSCGITNSAGGQQTQDVIFVTSDAGYNQVSLRIALTSGKAVLAPGSIPDPFSPPDPGAGTTIYLDLTELKLPASVWDQLTFDGRGWKFQAFPDRSTVGMTPAASPVPLSPGTAGAVVIGIRGIVVPAPLPAPQVQLYLSYYNIPDVPGMYVPFAVAIQNAHDQQSDLAEAIGVSLSASGIVTSVDQLPRAANRFALQFASRQRQVTPGPGTLFSVCFVYGKPGDPYGYGALTDIANATAFSVEAGDNAGGWTITRDSNAQAVTWALEPPGDRPIVGTGTESVVTINFSGVVTTYQPGPTVMLISYQGIPGYRDGTFTLVLNKIPHAVIRSLDVTPSPAYFKDRTAKVTAHWQVSGAQGLELTRDNQAISVTGKKDLPVTLDARLTTITLKATGQPGAAENTDYRTIQAVALPVIKSFTASPPVIYKGAAHDVSFGWVVDTPDDVTLSSTSGALDGQSFRPAGSTSPRVTGPQMVTLSSTTTADPVPVASRIVISAFQITPDVRGVDGYATLAVVASPTGPFLMRSSSTALTVVETITQSKIGTVALGHIASAMAFSADGGTLATANTDSTVAVVAVTLDSAGMPVFGPPATVPVGGAQQLVFSPDGQRIFVTVDPGGTAAGQLVSLLRSAAGFQVETTTSVGRQPRGIALDAGGGRLFVANSGDDTVTMVGLADGKPAATTTIGVAGGPTGVAATLDGKRLLVSCATAGTVVAIDPGQHGPSRRDVLTVGGSPRQIALLPGSSYAAVGNATKEEISLVDYSGQPSGLRLAGLPISIVAWPAQVTASPDGLQVYSEATIGFGLLTLSTYWPSTEVPGVPAQPTGVAFSADGDTVFAWQDARIPVQPPGSGVVVYRHGTRVISSLLAGQHVLDVAVSPDPLAKEAVAIVQGDPALHLIATDTLGTSAQPLGLPAGSAPEALALSGDGHGLYVVAADASRDLSLLVLAWRDPGWTGVQALPLYRATDPGRLLLRATPDGTTLFLASTAAAQVRVLRRDGQAYALSPTTLSGYGSVVDLAVLPDGSAAYLLSAGERGYTVTVIDVASLSARVVAIPSPSVKLTGLRPSPDGLRLFVSDTDAVVYMLDPRSLRMLQRIPLGAVTGQVSGTSGIAVRLDGSGLVTANTLSKNLSFAEQIQMAAAPAAAAVAGAPAAAGDGHTGLFLRRYLGQSPAAPADGRAESPDVVRYGGDDQPDASAFTSDSGYETEFTTDSPLQPDERVYVRVRNLADVPVASRVYLYHARGSLTPWPGDWRHDGITVDGAARNWAGLIVPAGAVAVTEHPITWRPPDGDHRSLIAWIGDGPGWRPPDLAGRRALDSYAELFQFIATHPSLAIHNVAEVARQPEDHTYRTVLSTGAVAETVYLRVVVRNLPSDGTFALTVLGPDEDGSLSQPAGALGGHPAGFAAASGPLVLPPGCEASVAVGYEPGPLPPPLEARITVELLTPIPSSLMRDTERRYRPAGLRTPLRSIRGVPVVLLGSVRYNLRFGAAGEGN